MSNPIDTIINDVGHITMYLTQILESIKDGKYKQNIQSALELVMDISVQAEMARQDLQGFQNRIKHLQSSMDNIEDEIDFGEYDEPSGPKPLTLRDKLRKEMEQPFQDTENNEES